MSDQAKRIGVVRPPPVRINQGVITKLEALLEKARAGLVSDVALLYFEDGHPSFSEDIAVARRTEFIGLAELWKASQVAKLEVELEDAEDE